MFGATLPVDTAGIVEAAKEIQFRPKMIGGAMLGLLITAIKQKLGPDINGYISNEFYIPAPSLQFDGTRSVPPGISEARAAARHRSARLYLSALRLCDRTGARQGGDRDEIARSRQACCILRANSFDTIIGPIKFGENGEWTTPRIICIQFQGISGHDVDQFKDWSQQVVVYPAKYQSGKLDYPFSESWKMKLGFVGLGAMGQLIVPRLMAAGHAVTGWNRSRDKADAFDRGRNALGRYAARCR